MTLRPDATEILTATLRERIMVIDGAMGTAIQRDRPDEAGYRGERFKDWPTDVIGNNDLLSLTQPQIIALAVLAGTVGMLIWGRLRSDVVALSGAALLLVTRVIRPVEVESAFASPAIIALACAEPATPQHANTPPLQPVGPCHGAAFPAQLCSCFARNVAG